MRARTGISWGKDRRGGEVAQKNKEEGKWGRGVGWEREEGVATKNTKSTKGGERKGGRWGEPSSASRMEGWHGRWRGRAGSGIGRENWKRTFGRGKLHPRCGVCGEDRFDAENMMYSVIKS